MNNGVPNKISLKEVEEKIQKASRREQHYFLMRLPYLLGIEEEDWTWLKMTEPSFDFWENPYDDRYNNL